jgi:hypothetical protein
VINDERKDDLPTAARLLCKHVQIFQQLLDCYVNMYMYKEIFAALAIPFSRAAYAFSMNPCPYE